MIDTAGLPDGPSKQQLMKLLEEVICFIGKDELNQELEARLNDVFGHETVLYKEVFRLLLVGMQEGWACYDAIGSEDYRRGPLGVANEGPHDFFLQSACLKNVKGDFHTHPLGEINLILPVDAQAKFCGAGAGWKVFAPQTSHYPTVTGGKCAFVFLLPKGEIIYKGKEPT